MTEINDNVRAFLDDGTFQEFLKQSMKRRIIVIRELKAVTAAEHDLDRKNLFHSAVNLLELDDRVTVYFDTREGMT